MKRLLSRLWIWTRRLLVVGAGLGVVGAIAGGVLYKRHVLDEPGEHIAPDAIMAVIAQESPVLYRDGETRVGVFFAQEHRDYVPYARIPQAWVQAIVAAEDQRFFEHPGIDAKGIARAMRDNAEAGRVVAGGSTLTQQTAKNLFYRPDRSLRSKWEELVNALRLEAHFEKEQILEFYANQFHVSANGRGLGIAARYFFDKEVEELTTLECAYLAGMVKAPATYNPFLGNSEERRAVALQRAHDRTRYVLDRMLVTGALTASQHDKLVKEKLPFSRGTFRYDTHVILDEVADRLERAPFPELFAELGIDNPSTAGIQVVTTIDAELQRASTWALWHHLTEVGPLMEGGAEAWPGVGAFLLPDSQAPRQDPHDPLHRWEFRAASVLSVDAAAPSVALDVGGHPCQLDAEQIERANAIALQGASGNSWTRATTAGREALLAALTPGAVVWVSVLEEATADRPARCALELRPELQGAAMVLEDGQIRAMVGGNDNKNFNRAVTARRQLGSTWKPVLYHTAMQLGWAPTDVLDNRPDQPFHFEGTWYYPRPDHSSEPFVSLAWAGTRSENVASIWLLAHLVDRLEHDDLVELATAVDLVPRKGEARGDWIKRIRDDWGVISTEERLPAAAFEAVKPALVAELLEAGKVDEAREVQAILYGSGAQAEVKRLRKGRGNAAKVRNVQFNLLRLEELSDACAVQAEALDRAMRTGGRVMPSEVGDLRLRPWQGSLQLGCGDVGEGWASVGEHLLAAIAEGVVVPLGDPGAMLIEGRVHRDTLLKLRRAMTRRVLVMRQADPWSVEVLIHHPDYRQLLAMRYLALVARRLGVAEELPPVLSLPLGAVDLSLEEAAGLYQGMLAGEAWTFPGQAMLLDASRSVPVGAPAAGTLLIAEIRDWDGAVLYRAQPTPVALTDAVPGQLVGDILRNVVKHGTGRRADGAVTLGGKPVPVAGKTGTTNSYRNAAFVGFVPRAVASAEGPVWRWGQGFTVATYVGYDDNREMRRGSTRLQGSSGALPAWIGIGQALADTGMLGKAPPASSEWQAAEGFSRVPVAQGSGLALDDAALAAGADASRTVLVAHPRGIFGVKPELLRVVAPMQPAADSLGAAPVIHTADALDATTPLIEDSGTTGPPPEEATPTEGLPEHTQPEDAQPEEAPAAAPTEDPIEAWLGDLLEETPPVEAVDAPVGDSGGGDEINPRIAPSGG